MLELAVWKRDQAAKKRGKGIAFWHIIGRRLSRCIFCQRTRTNLLIKRDTWKKDENTQFKANKEASYPINLIWWWLFENKLCYKTQLCVCWQRNENWGERGRLIQRQKFFILIAAMPSSCNFNRKQTDSHCIVAKVGMSESDSERGEIESQSVFFL